MATYMAARQETSIDSDSLWQGHARTLVMMWLWHIGSVTKPSCKVLGHYMGPVSTAPHCQGAVLFAYVET